MRPRLFCTSVFAAGLLALAGCTGSPPEPPTGDVSGTVTTGGTKLTGGSIKFTPAGGGTAVAATVGYEGTYRTTVLPPGDYTVTVETAFLGKLYKIGGSISAAPPEKRDKSAAKKADPGPTTVQVPKKYEKVAETTLKLTVKPGVQVADFDCP